MTSSRSRDKTTAANARNPRGEQTRQRILDAAEQLFAEFGFAETRLEDVALQVGIRRPSLIYYFKDKQALYDAVKTDIYSDLHERTLARLPQGSALLRLESLFDSWLDFMIARPSAAHIVLRNTIERRQPRQAQQARFSEAVVKTFEQIVGEGRRAGEFDEEVNAVQLLMLIGNGILNFVCNGPAIGAGRAYDPAAAEQAESYRRLLHKTLHALLSTA